MAKVWRRRNTSLAIRILLPPCFSLDCLHWLNLTDMTVTKGRRLSWSGCIQVQQCTAKMGTDMTQLYSYHGSLADSHKGSARSCTAVSKVRLLPEIRNQRHKDILFQFCTHGLVFLAMLDYLVVLEPAEDRTSHFSTFTHSWFGETFQQKNIIVGSACCTWGKN